ncbi:MAG: patatin-like phospholipase family protein [Candidatus Gracilibacteria bacterium]|nr:patatin-like phospholipase family protein [Candidatus Gracilibacteria bacterium]
MQKTYSLALGGGAARGIAHIGVIKYLEEKNIIINEIAGTSMGAIIGACFAIGKTSEEMTQIIKDIKFLKLIDLNFKESIISGDKVYKMLENIFGDLLIENTLIPLKIVATNLESGEKHIFTSGKIIDAVRASINLPTIFKPFEINGIKYLDGGLNSNLPILELNGNDIIAVSVVRENNKEIIYSHKVFLGIKFKTSFWKYNYQILKKTISIVMRNNEDFCMTLAQNSGKNIILIKPDVGDYEYYDFIKYDEISKKGYEEIKDFKF